MTMSRIKATMLWREFKLETSLEFNYYFRCECVLCSDEREANLEEHAAPIECGQCSEPYFWTKVLRPEKIACCMFWRKPKSAPTLICRKSCTRVETRRELEAAKKLYRSLHAKERMCELEHKWTRAMSGSMRSRSATLTVAECVPILSEALKFWHPSRNLRLAQLCERVFVSYNALVTCARKESRIPDKNGLLIALCAGEVLLAWCSHYPSETYRTMVAAYCSDLARLYEIAASISENIKERKNNWHCASMWYLDAASIWQSYGNKCAGFVAQLKSRADSAKSAATDWEADSSE